MSAQDTQSPYPDHGWQYQSLFLLCLETRPRHHLSDLAPCPSLYVSIFVLSLIAHFKSPTLFIFHGLLSPPQPCSALLSPPLPIHRPKHKRPTILTIEINPLILQISLATYMPPKHTTPHRSHHSPKQTTTSPRSSSRPEPPPPHTPTSHPAPPRADPPRSAS